MKKGKKEKKGKNERAQQHKDAKKANTTKTATQDNRQDNQDIVMTDAEGAVTAVPAPAPAPPLPPQINIHSSAASSSSTSSAPTTTSTNQKDPHDQKACFNWQKKGKCRKGDRCSYKHETKEELAARNATRQNKKNKKNKKNQAHASSTTTATTATEATTADGTDGTATTFGSRSNPTKLRFRDILESATTSMRTSVVRRAAQPVRHQHGHQAERAEVQVRRRAEQPVREQRREGGVQAVDGR
jgi:hypothetical protein